MEALAEMPPLQAVEVQSGKPRRVLVVDDDDNIRELNARLLARSGYHVDAAADGEDAWQALNANLYDLVLTDHNMPNVSGVELLERIHAAGMVIRTVMVTGAFPEKEFHHRPWLLPLATLAKPYTPDALLGTVHNVLTAGPS